MGFFSSFKGQLGRDTGRLVSNKLFGNRHAIKHQSVDNKVSLKSKRNLLELEKGFIQRQEKEAENIRNTKAVVSKNIKRIAEMKIPNKQELIIEQLHALSIEFVANKWKDTDEEENKISNDYTEAIFKKYEQGLLALKTKFPNSTELPYLEKQYWKYKKQRLFHRYNWVLLVLILFIIIGAMFVMSKIYD